jgi:HAD superfamily hydrolase (TIGR01549 family)
MKQPQHVSFDLDGTLIDSFPVMRAAWENVCREFSLAIPFEQYRLYIGVPFEVIMSKLGLSESCDDIKKVYFDYTQRYASDIAVFDGQSKLFSRLRDNNISISIITSKPRANAQHLIEKFDFDVDFLICGNDFAVGKPHPRPMDELLKNLDIERHTVVYIGDMLSDLQFAVNSNVEFIFFSGGEYSDINDLVLNPRRVATSLKDLAVLLNV